MILARNRWSRLAILLPSIGLLAAMDAAAVEKPNVVVIVGDDMGYADISLHGCKDVATPHIDSIAAGGVQCTNGYVSGPYCSPTRAGLLTGRYQTRFGHEFNPGGVPGPSQGSTARKQLQRGSEAPGLPLSETTIADRLHDAGYRTALVGKWHLGMDAAHFPLRRGFDEFYGFLGGSHGYFSGGEAPIYRGEEPIEEKEYLTDAIGREAVAFIDRQKDKPFFLYLAFNAVHTPMQADDARLKEFAHIKDKQRRTYAAMMSAMDDAIGVVLAKLRDEGLERNTLVFFISDNGGPTISNTTINGAINTPFRGSKKSTAEGGVRVPFLVKWPGHVPAGEKYNQPVIQLDILPTVLAAAGIDPPNDAELDGVNLLPHFNRQIDAVPHKVLYWRFGKQMAIRKGDWKLVRYHPLVDGQPAELNSATEAKLYNLAEDGGEKNDLIDKEPEKAKELQADWDKWNKGNVPARWGMDGNAKKAKSREERRAARQRAASGSSGGN
jgi:arylsulfatase A-like enzyme